MLTSSINGVKQEILSLFYMVINTYLTVLKKDGITYI